MVPCVYVHTSAGIPGMRGSFDQANLPQHNANNLGDIAYFMREYDHG